MKASITMEAVRRCLLFPLRAVSWPVAVCLGLGVVTWGVFYFRLVEVFPWLYAFFYGVAPFIFLTPAVIFARLLWGVFRLCQRRTRAGLTIVLVEVPLAVGAYFLLCWAFNELFKG